MDWIAEIKNRFYAFERFVRFVVDHFIEDDCTYIASALAFTSLLAVVPLMSVGLAVLSSFPVFQGVASPLQDFIFNNFVPATGKVVQEYLQQFTAQVSKLSIWGVAFLIITSLLVMYTIERGMNKIWRVNTSRRGVPAFLLYWAILSLAPVILGLSLAASSYFISLPLLSGSPKTPSFLFHWSPFLLSLIGFCFLYIVVPNCQVRFRHAFWGGLFAAILFETAKQGFAYYLTNYNTYELLYGAFATVPIFFIWVYWVWIITLLGAEISYALSVHHQRRDGQPIDGFSHALLWLYQLWVEQQKGKGLTFNELIDSCNQPFMIDADSMLSELSHEGLIHLDINGEYRLSRDLGQMSLYDLTQIVPYRLPSHMELNQPIHHSAELWRDVFIKNDLVLRESLHLNLEQLFKSR